ncbi:MAG: hypothetical protein SA398_01865 [Methanosarcina sp.]|nr:hypothetical protein [Methanosarcina sp.]MDW5552682.1 hypothetical protein [Methanosarcina sp.]
MNTPVAHIIVFPQFNAQKMDITIALDPIRALCSIAQHIALSTLESNNLPKGKSINLER